MTTTWGIGGESALSLHAPHASEAFTELIRMRPDDVDRVTFGAIRTVTADALDLPPLQGARLDDEPPPALIGFAEQFALDVAEVQPSVRESWLAHTEGQTWSATQLVFVADIGPRVRAALNQLFSEDEWLEPPEVAVPEPAPVVAGFHNELARVNILDPVTAEMVRLRCARLHQARVEMYRRSVAAISAGATAKMFEGINSHRTSSLPATTKGALRLADAMVQTPASIGMNDLAAIRAYLTPREAVAVVLAVARHSVHKISVGLGMNAPTESQIEFFTTDANGRTVPA